MGTLLPSETSSSTLCCKGGGASSGLVGQGEKRGAHPYSQIGQMHHTIAALLIQTPCHTPCYPCPTHVPHLSPPIPPLLLPVLLHVPLCLIVAVPTIPVNVLLLLAIAIGSSPLRPSPSFRLAHWVFSSSWHVGHPAASPSWRRCFACSHMREQTYHANWSLASPQWKYKPPTGLRTSDGSTWPNG